ncbi:hypothetical protein M2105_002513 [Paenibacillus sp. PastF-1]|nr:hypothetical protein [Paenibacillus sp. PastF-2]MDF9848087.1 hypothetical protein [Paenibacillus sp. PastM-2]MDF9854656.1 hypothetical protein [Paenibacillus sp. PastF-1]MDH6479736.1 hypothetical protein [Paenibacillus sp. PastH-2]MDH6507362.1 hypothetical protein [Paenibacillus sp. PastM-3]
MLFTLIRLTICATVLMDSINEPFAPFTKRIENRLQGPAAFSQLVDNLWRHLQENGAENKPVCFKLF